MLIPINYDRLFYMKNTQLRNINITKKLEYMLTKFMTKMIFSSFFIEFAVHRSATHTLNCK